ncbi:MAG: decaprenyl-phosphate phosphoribosyltransferase [Isosphaeraceae bacterium]|jgi:4-hydroxybenzoate polyprenyltransferase
MDANLTADAILTKPGVGLRSLIPLAQAARPRQWIKNLACFAGLVFSGRMFEPVAIVESILAFAGFCLAASAVYLLNDVVDRRLDRLNPSKRDRPIASGLVPVSWALGASGLLAVGALGTTIRLASICLMVLTLYLAVNVAYSLRLKHTVLLDVLIIAFGFVLRVLYGVYAIEVKPTSWIVLCMFFLALFLGFAKRRGEMHLMGEAEPFRRPVLSKYRIGYLDLMLGMTATLAILCYALYTVTGHRGNASLVVTVPLVTYGVSRYMLLVTVDGEGEAPEKLLVTDRILLGTGALWVASCVLVIYSKIQLFAE